jgi:DNA-binding transcriptional regulator/RsmH inhibitor MraZ
VGQSGRVWGKRGHTPKVSPPARPNFSDSIDCPMAHLLGTSRHKFDDKWRVVLPAQHRDVIGGTLYFAPGDDGQVSLFPESAFDERIEKKRAEQAAGIIGVREFLIFTGGANRISMDAQSRVVLPEQFRQAMTLDVVIIGAGSWLEFWSAPHHESFFGPTAGGQKVGGRNV